VNQGACRDGAGRHEAIDLPARQPVSKQLDLPNPIIDASARQAIGVEIEGRRLIAELVEHSLRSTAPGRLLRMRGLTRIALFLVGVVIIPTVAHAQGSITGTVKDVSGAVLPGVTVEAASPALIEKVRTVVTDGTGQFKILDLRPGAYTVTFTLSGFSTVKREGVELTGSFAATVNVELKVGTVAETITVKGEAPIVDVQNMTQERVLSKDIVDAIPSGRTQYTTVTLIPGVSAIRDVGGTSNLQLAGTATIHGGNGGDTRTMIDGLSIGDSENSGAQTNQLTNMGSTQELTVDYAAGTAEQAYAGVRMNLIPRDGGNTFKASAFGTYVNSWFQGSNYTQALKSQGLAAPNSLVKAYDFNPSGGGRIVPDKLWFFTSGQWVENDNTVAGRFYNLNAGNPNSWTYAPDLSRQAFDRINQDAGNGRITWQATSRNKFSVYIDDQSRCWCNYSGGYSLNPGGITPSPEAMSRLTWPNDILEQVVWSSPLTNRLLLEARFQNRLETYAYPPLQPDGSPNPNLVQVTDQAIGLSYRSGGMASNGNRPFQTTRQSMQQVNASLSYVTGAHAFKVGFSDLVLERDSNGGSSADTPFPYAYTFNNGVPTLITEWAIPYSQEQRQPGDVGLYAQDKWTINKLTLNLGVRYDGWSSSYPAQHLGPGPLVPNRDLSFPQTDAFSYKDITPRIGAAYDLFGNGKTAIRASVGKYMLSQSVGQSSPTDLYNPANRLAAVVTRSWKPTGTAATNPNYYDPQCDLLNPQANGQCGTISNLNFGTSTPSTNLDPNILNGWGKRPYQWELTTNIQQALSSRVSMNVGYFRRVFGNFLVTDNTLVAPSDFSPYSIAAPLNPGLPGGGGYTISGLYDLNPNKVGQVNNLITFASNYGTQIQHWNGADLTIDARPRQGILLQGGISTGRTSTDICAIVNNPNYGGNPSPLYCHQDTNFLTQVKLLGVYTVPKVEVQLSATFQSYPGPAITASYLAPNALVAPSLGRNLSGGAANEAVSLVAPGTIYGGSSNQFDVRLGKILRFSRFRTVASLDCYNCLNGSSVLTLNTNFAAWQVPLSILNARLFKFSLQFDF
jgi:hypothetical protein